MSFTGKSTYTAGVNLPELAEDVSDIIGIVSPYETPLLDALGDSLRSAASTYHQWLEDELLPNKDMVRDDNIVGAATCTEFDVLNPGRFRIGDQIQIDGSYELMLVTAITGSALTVVRGYAGTTPRDIADEQVINILGNAALEGADKPTARFTNRVRKSNFTQIFTAAVEVSGSDLTANQLGLPMKWTTRNRNASANCCVTSKTPSSTAAMRPPIRRARPPYAARCAASSSI